jgi:hypothetical protein
MRPPIAEPEAKPIAMAAEQHPVRRGEVILGHGPADHGARSGHGDRGRALGEEHHRQQQRVPGVGQRDRQEHHAAGEVAGDQQPAQLQPVADGAGEQAQDARQHAGDEQRGDGDRGLGGGVDVHGERGDGRHVTGLRDQPGPDEHRVAARPPPGDGVRDTHADLPRTDIARMSGHSSGTWSSDSSRLAGSVIARHPSGTVLPSGQMLYCSSSFPGTDDCPRSCSAPILCVHPSIPVIDSARYVFSSTRTSR